MTESHTAANLAEVLSSAVTYWDLKRMGKNPSITTDNASNIVNGVRDANLYPHVRCFAHTINLATQRGLKVAQMDRLLGRVHRIVSFFHRSAVASATLKGKQTMLSIPEHKLIQDVSTRWNSSYEMLSRYLEQQAAIYATFMSPNIRRSEKDIIICHRMISQQ